jgi:hypothetical protein
MKLRVFFFLPARSTPVGQPNDAVIIAILNIEVLNSIFGVQYDTHLQHFFFSCVVSLCLNLLSLSKDGHKVKLPINE